MRWIDLLKMLPASILILILLTPNAGFSEGRKKDCGPGGRIDARTKRCICPEGYAVKVGRCECPEGQTEVDIEGKKACGRMFGPAKKPLGKSGPTASEPQPARSSEIVIYEAGQSTKDPRLGLKVKKAEATRLFKQLFPKYLTNWSQCPREMRAPEHNLEAGEFMPEVQQAAVGAFTAPNVRETLYRVSFGTCNGRDLWSGGLLVVTQGDAVAVRSVMNPISHLSRVVDFDNDGQDELLLEMDEYDDDAPPSRRSLRAGLVQFKNGTLETIKDISHIAINNTCLSEEGPRRYDYSVVSVVSEPGKAPEFIVKTKVDSCENAPVPDETD